MNKKEIKVEFLRKLELFYRNFGNEWTINDFAKKSKEKKIIAQFLTVLSKKGVIDLQSDGKSFKVIDLPSNHEDLI